jgi:uncharacterized protein
MSTLKSYFLSKLDGIIMGESLMFFNRGGRVMDIKVVVKWVAIVLIIVGALNWGLVGAFHLNVVEMLFGAGMVTRVIYVAIGLAGLYKIFMIVKK